MRFSLLSLILISSFFYLRSNAQSIQLSVVQDTIFATTDQSEEFTSLIVKNISSDVINVRVDRIVENLANGHETYFCWDQCYPPTTGSSGGTLKINAGDSVSSFTAHIIPNGYEGISLAQFLFSNEDLTDDTASVSLTFNVEKASSVYAINDKNIIHISMGLYDQSIDIQSELIIQNLNVSVYKINGQLVFQNQFKKAQALNIPTSQFSNGIYFIHLSSSILNYSQKLAIVR
jgi:hypothetical protein